VEAKVKKTAASPTTAVPREQGGGSASSSLRVEGSTHFAGFTALIILLAATLFISILICTSFGAVQIPVSAMVSALLHKQALSETQHTILFAIRLPRVLASAIVGAALAVLRA